jgi:multicomponent Na+:H+ antiporter subunit D
MMSPGTIPLFVAVPLAGAFLTALLKRVKGFPDAMGVMATVCTFALSVFAVLRQLPGERVILDIGSWGARLIPGSVNVLRTVGIQLALDGLSTFMLVVVNFIAFLVAVYSINYMTRFTSKAYFYILFLLMVAGMNGVIITGDLFNLFVFVEIASLASYALVAFGTGKRELEAAFKYAVMGGVGSLLVLLGIIFLYSNTGTLNMMDMSRWLAEHPGSEGLRNLVLGLFLAGFGLKAALVPFHAWLPDAHPSAPAPISAMLSGVLIKSLGVYAICRVLFNIFGITPQLSSMLMGLGALSMSIGVILALRQWDMKRLLAYHSISQIGYIILGIGIGTPLGILGGLFHLFNHSIFKSLLFLDAGAVEYSTGTRNLKELGGLSRRMPVTSWTTLSASMSIAGIPPFSGFWSKLIIVMACVQQGLWFYAFITVLVSILTLASFMKIMRYGFLGTIREAFGKVSEVPAFMRIALVTLALVCILGGLLLLPGLKNGFLGQAVQVLINGRGV